MVCVSSFSSQLKIVICIPSADAEEEGNCWFVFPLGGKEKMGI
jgi:hypothetical protein